MVLILLGTLAAGAMAASAPVSHWPLDGVDGETAADATEARPATVRGACETATGAVGASLRFDGITSILSVDPQGLDFTGDFSVALWVNVYSAMRGQQMIIAKNRYSLNEREWGLMVDADGLFTLYVRHDGWKTVNSTTRPQPGHWQHLAAVLRDGTATLYVDGRVEGSVETGPVEAVTAAPITIGGSDDNGRLWQMLWGAVDDVKLYDQALSADEVAAMQVTVTDTHDVQAMGREAEFMLWDPNVPIPDANTIERLPSVRFEVVKLREPEVDGYVWLHGMAIYRYKGVFYVSWGANKGKENTIGEVVLGRRSSDDCRTWSDVEVIGGPLPGEGRSHGVFLEHDGALWAFHCRFGKGEGTHFPGQAMEAFRLNEATDAWEPVGIVGRSIWPDMEPVTLPDGNWFTAGMDEDWLASVAMSHGEDLTQWDTVKIPVGGRTLSEANGWVDDEKITLVMRNHSPLDPGNIRAAVSLSRDGGRTWSDPVESNLPLSTSKPYCGVLSTGQRFFLGNSVQGGNYSRAHLTIAVSRPGEEQLCRMWLIRDATIPESLQETYGYADRQALAYPHAIEHDGHLYVVYSAGHLPANQNSGELAVIPVADLAVD